MEKAKFQVHDLRLSAVAKHSPKENPDYILVVGAAKTFKSAKTFSLFSQETQERIKLGLKRKKEDWKPGQSLTIPAVKETDFNVLLAALPENCSMHNLLEFARDRLKLALPVSAKSIALVFLESKHEAHLSEAFGAATAARCFLMPLYGKRVKDQKKYQLAHVYLATSKKQLKSFDYGVETGEGSNLVRRLGTLPPNELNTKNYGFEIRRLCKEHKIDLKFHSNAQLKKMGAGAFTAVDQGDPDSSGGIYELSYSPSRAKNKKPISLVGKGLCYDTGGYDIKTGGFMATMKGDMQGSAVALSSLLTLARLKLPIKAKAFLGVTENHISPKAYKADDVIIALNGKSIEVVNTDAEGRMVLADTLTLATKQKPELCIDFATLTGMAVYSIGTRYSAGFTNNETYHSRIVNAGKDSGERVWTFPLDKDYGKSLESPIADTLQCSRGRGVDHILAAYFLQGFVEEKTNWVHIDLSAAENKGGLAHTDSDFTGFGVRWTLEFLRKFYRL